MLQRSMADIHIAHLPTTSQRSSIVCNTFVGRKRGSRKHPDLVAASTSKRLELSIVSSAKRQNSPKQNYYCKTKRTAAPTQLELACHNRRLKLHSFTLLYFLVVRRVGICSLSRLHQGYSFDGHFKCSARFSLLSWLSKGVMCRKVRRLLM